jgi:molybdopterin/thiamine biosynthesis adenylyltransferase
MKTVILIGAGGNIGSHLVPHLGRMPGIDRIMLVDRDIYEGRNLVSQDIIVSDIGKPKSQVQARRLHKINPDLRVTPVVGSVEDLPLAHLRADVILTALDSRRSRQCVNEVAWRLSVPWCDSGVRTEELLARVVTYMPGNDEPCMECAWSESDYDQIDQVYPCQDVSEIHGTPTNAPSCLGALAAALQALECRKILQGQFDRLAIGCQTVIDAQWHRNYVTRFRRNPGCRFDHKSWTIEKLHCNLDRFTIEDALQIGDRIELDRVPFIKKLTCKNCGLERSLLYLAAALSPALRRCSTCETHMTATGFDILERIDSRQPKKILRRSLRSIGLRQGDIFHSGNGRYFEIAGDDS